MNITLSKNGRLEIALHPSDIIDQAYLQEFQKASHSSTPPKIRVEGSSENLTLSIFLEKPSVPGLE
jgi:hypothetical protein